MLLVEQQSKEFEVLVKASRILGLRDLKSVPICQGLEGGPVFKLDVLQMQYVFGEMSNL